ncbi:MAG: hypothetical protein WDM85_08265 [Caulobacteraceae bacterium]
MVFSQVVALAVVLAACFAVFGVLGRLFPCNPGRPLLVSRSIGLDMGGTACLASSTPAWGHWPPRP